MPKKESSQYRSKFEKTFARHLRSRGVKFKYESMRVGYLKEHFYKPDFILSNGIIIETKGRFTAYDRAKHLLIKKQHPELDIRFVFLADNKLTKRSSTRYSDWCKRHGFKYAFKTMPAQWVEETKNERQ
jgi:hypothetical protein